MDCSWLVQKLASYTCMCSAYTLHGSLALTLFRAHAQWNKLQWWEQMSIMQIHKCPKALTVIADKSNFQLDKASSYVHSSCWIHRYDYSVSQAVVIPIHNHSCDWASWHRKGVVESLRILRIIIIWSKGQNVRVVGNSQRLKYSAVKLSTAFLQYGQVVKQQQWWSKIVDLGHSCD